jgi:hypothetical protein
MYSEQLAVLLFIAATQVAGQGVGAQPMAQVPRNAVPSVVSSVAALPQPRLTGVNKTRQQIKRERKNLMLAQFH